MMDPNNPPKCIISQFVRDLIFCGDARRTPLHSAVCERVVAHRARPAHRGARLGGRGSMAEARAKDGGAKTGGKRGGGLPRRRTDEGMALLREIRAAQ